MSLWLNLFTHQADGKEEMLGGLPRLRQNSETYDILIVDRVTQGPFFCDLLELRKTPSGLKLLFRLVLLTNNDNSKADEVLWM